MTVFAFPGQGSQRRGMGIELFDQVAEFKTLERDIDRCLGYSVRRICLEDPDHVLSRTQFTQPCLYVVNALYYYRTLADGVWPSAVVGHSLGEYNALLAAGAFDFMTGLRLVQRRGQLMSRAKDGGMAAIKGLDAVKIKRLLLERGLDRLDVANYNTPFQTVVSGPTQDITRAEKIFLEAGATLYMPLPVSAAFHSRYMTDAANTFREFLELATFKSLTIPVISNVTARPYPEGDPTSSVRSALVNQITSSVRWTDSVRYLLEEGATSFREVGPGEVLTKLIAEIQDAVTNERRHEESLKQREAAQGA